MFVQVTFSITKREEPDLDLLIPQGHGLFCALLNHIWLLRLQQDDNEDNEEFGPDSTSHGVLSGLFDVLKMAQAAALSFRYHPLVVYQE